MVKQNNQTGTTGNPEAQKNALEPSKLTEK